MNFQEDGPIHSVADGSAESAADWSARILEQADGGEARFPPMGMELGVPGDGQRVAAGEEPTSARIPTASGEVVTMEEEISFGALFKNSKSSKNGYKIRDYKDRLRRNVAVALLQILQPHQTTYLTSWQVGFVELALSGAPIHWARILWKATRQHAQEEKGVSINHLSPFLINFYRSMGCLTASERVQFPLLSRSNPGRNRTQIKVATNPELISLDNKYRELEEKNNCLHGHLTLSWRLHKIVLQLRVDAMTEAQRKFEKHRAKIEAELHSRRIQNGTLAEELVRQTRLLKQCQIARKEDEELLRHLQSQCDELRAQRADAELQLVEFEGDNWLATKRTREELVARMNRYLRGYTLWEVAARERVTVITH
ncbi:hypothetical protein AXG93_4015s1010 [Marchantia polymorpha subsp. ruderalis]|uniref:Uncharacterized protein n=1 Tax=Marchantia polymorpha subsp. ruderalis TaxID=1480154 RepID=A0A176VSC1_MARPO|nr:hypothetical protein AXG93_4015s1010 [Marchantia polymorpha subsp. ruderalis]